MEKLWDLYFGVLWCIPSQLRYKTTQKKIKKKCSNETNETRTNAVLENYFLFLTLGKMCTQQNGRYVRNFLSSIRKSSIMFSWASFSFHLQIENVCGNDFYFVCCYLNMRLILKRRHEQSIPIILTQYNVLWRWLKPLDEFKISFKDLMTLNKI